MALQTQIFTTGSFDYQSPSNGYVLDLIVTEESVDTLENTSLVSYKLQLRSGENNRFSGYVSCRVTMAGETTEQTNIGIDAAYNQTYLLLSGSKIVSHEQNGSGTLAFDAVFFPPANNPYAPPELTVAGFLPLTAIARASAIAASDAYIEGSATIAVARKSAGYTHSIRYQFGSLSGYLQDAVGSLGTQEKKLTAQTVILPIPQSFYGEIPNAPSGKCTLTCKTYSGQTQVGKETTAVFTVTADPARCAPTVTGTAEDTDATCLALTGSSQRLIKGKSDVQCTFRMTARNGASLKSKYVNAALVTGSSYTVTNISAGKLVLQAMDSRGYTTSYTVPGLSFVEYFPLTVNGSVKRTDPTSGKAELQIHGKWFSGSFGKENNALTVQYKIGSGSWQTVTAVTEGDRYSQKVSLSGLAYDATHKITIRVADQLTSLEKTLTLGKGIPVFDWGERDFQFHVPVIFTASDGTKFTLELTNGQLSAKLQ